MGADEFEGVVFVASVVNAVASAIGVTGSAGAEVDEGVSLVVAFVVLEGAAPPFAPEASASSCAASSSDEADDAGLDAL